MRRSVVAGCGEMTEIFFMALIVILMLFNLIWIVICSIVTFGYNLDCIQSEVVSGAYALYMCILRVMGNMYLICLYFSSETCG